MAEFFVRRPIVAMVISILTALAGIVSMLRLPVAQFPQIVPPEVQVNAVFTGADAQTVEQSVATPLEQQINGVDNMLYLKSTSVNDGTVNLLVSFEVGTNPDMNSVLVQNRVSQALPSLPAEVKNYGVTTKKSLAFPLLVISLYSPKGTYDGTFLGNYATINLNEDLKRISGVGDVRNAGAADYAMRIWVQPDRLAELSLTVEDIQQAVLSQNTVNPAGKIGAEPAPPGTEFTYAARAQGRLTEVSDFENIAVRLNPDGSAVRLRDVAQVNLGAQTYNQIGRYNGNPAAVILLYQSPGSNALEVAKKAKQTLAELSKKFPTDLAYDVTLDTTIPVEEGMKEIVQTLLEALVLVILVVFLFLQSWRATLIPLLTVPVSLLGAFIFFPFFGFTINTLSLFGLVLAIGLVVDDAIVVVEAVQHHLEHGLSPRDATLKAMKEVTGPVIAIALILSAVFIPTAFMAGITGQLYQQFALTIAFSVLISAVNALTLSPALSSILLRPPSPNPGLMGRFFGGFNRAFDRLTGGYVGLSGILIRKSLRSLLLLGICTAGAVQLGRMLPSGFLPDEDNGYAMVYFQLPDAASLQRTDAVARKLEAIVASTPGVRACNAIPGFDLITGTTSTYTGTLFVVFDPYEKRKSHALSFRGIVQNLNQKFFAIPEAQAFAFLPPAIPGFGSASGFSLMLQDRSGGSIQQLGEVVQRFLAAARHRPELAGVTTLLRAGVPQVFVKVDRDKALKLGVEVQDLYTTLQTLMGGSYLNDFNRFGRQWRVYLQSDPNFRLRAEDIERFFVRNRTGGMVPLATLVSVENTTGPEFTNRFNLYRSAEIIGAAAPGYSSGQALQAIEEVAQKVLPSTMSYSWNTLAFQQKRAEGTATGVFILSLVFVFLILAALYESWSLPFSVLLTTPLAVLGAFAGLFLRGLELNVYAQIGLVMLIGLAAKNSILIVEFAKAEFEKGKTIVEAALEGARLRLRPILMTSFAFILGCVPLWTADGAGAVARRVMGTAVIMGMLVATLIGIFLTPFLYVFITRLVTKSTEQQKA